MVGIRTLEVQSSPEGTFSHIRLVFGPHSFLELNTENNGNLTFVLGATHHGFCADASEVGGALEQFIEEIRRTHPESRVD